MKKFLKILMVLIFPFVLISCGGSSKTDTKVDSKVLNIYTWTYFVPDQVIENFEKETGIKVNVTYYDSNDTMLSRLLSGDKQFDIVSPSTDFVDIMIKKGLLEKLDKAKLGNTFKNLDERLGLDKISKTYDPGMQYSIPYGFFATGITVNTAVYGKDFPRDLSIFFNDKFKGQMTMLDDGRECLGLALQSLGYPSDSADDKQLEEAKDLLIKIKNNLAKYDATTFGKGLASGEYVVSHGYPDLFYEDIPKEEMDKFVYFLPKGAMMYIDNFAITSFAPDKDNAYKFLEYLYRPENYKYYFEMSRQIPVVKGVEALTDVKPIVPYKEVIDNSILPKGLTPEAREKQDKIWQEIKLAQ